MSLPWTCVGQTVIGAIGSTSASSVVNPAPNLNRLVGECPALPYLVPDGHTLTLLEYGIESYGDPKSVVMVPFFGNTSSPTNAMCGPSCSSALGITNSIRPRLVIPPGAWLGFKMMNAQIPFQGWAYGWFARGALRPQEPA